MWLFTSDDVLRGPENRRVQSVPPMKMLFEPDTWLLLLTFRFVRPVFTTQPLISSVDASKRPMDCSGPSTLLARKTADDPKLSEKPHSTKTQLSNSIPEAPFVK